jgi:hypothetical protein
VIARARSRYEPDSGSPSAFIVLLGGYFTMRGRFEAHSSFSFDGRPEAIVKHCEFDYFSGNSRLNSARNCQFGEASGLTTL